MTEENLLIDARLMASLMKLGIVQSQYDLSRLCGMNDSYHSSMKAKRCGMSIGSLVHLCANLSHLSRNLTDPKICAVLHQAITLVNESVQQKCQLQRLEFGMI